MREFRPPVRPSTLRTVLAVVLCAVVLAGLVPLVLVAAGGARVTYAMTQGTLVVDTGSWLDGRRSVPRSLVRDARPVTLRGARRTRGTAMPGYCTGRWTYADLGAVWQATDCSPQAVMVTTADGEAPIVVTPPDRAAFLQALDTGIDFGIQLPAPSTVLPRLFMVGVITAALVTSAMVVATLLLGPSRMVYRVGEGRLEVRTLFGRRTWSAASLRARAQPCRLQLRIAGTAVGGYYTGLYLADGKRTRVYATDPTDGVVLEGPVRVFLSPQDRQGFLAALRAEGATIEA